MKEKFQSSSSLDHVCAYMLDKDICLSLFKAIWDANVQIENSLPNKCTINRALYGLK